MLNVFHPDASTASTLTLLPVPAYVSFQQDPQYGELKLARNTPPMYGNAGRLSKVVNPGAEVALAASSFKVYAELRLPFVTRPFSPVEQATPFKLPLGLS